ncbi:MAG TPA: hypothetical protein VMT88_01575, partial [Actinomycetes bacterium]|nr:hypothetical protein [Actinomycetes bacterium]
LRVDGRSLTDVFDNVADPRAVVLEDHDAVTKRHPGGWLQRGLVTDRWEYVRFPPQHKFEELYDLKSDPYERVNLAYRRAYQSDLNHMRNAWTRFKDCAGAECRDK